MKIVFTLCSNNYLAQAKILGDSLKENNPDWFFIIGLVDRKTSLIDYNFFKPHHIVSIEELGIKNFDEYVNKFNIIELNTNVKPLFFQYIFDTYSSCELAVYLDPDIKVYHKFDDLEQIFNETANEIVLTPHSTKPIPMDGKMPDERLFLNFGIYNLGFLALKRSYTAYSFIKWWTQRLAQYGYMDVANGMFTDQLWINLAPLYFSNVFVIKHPGYNMAFWNLHYRELKKSINGYFIDRHPLVFYHFSGYRLNEKYKIAKSGIDRYDLKSRIDLIPLFEDYKKDLIQNRIDYFSQITCFYQKLKMDNKKLVHRRKLLSKPNYLFKYMIKKLSPIR